MPKSEYADHVKLVCDQREIRAALDLVTRSASTRSSVAVMQGVALTTGTGSVRLSCTDMETSLHTASDAKIARKGTAVVLEAKNVLKAIKTLEDGPLEIEVFPEDKSVRLTQGTLSLDFPLAHMGDWPKLPATLTNKANVRTADFMGAWELVGVAPSKDESRPVLCGVSMTTANGELTMATTDSYRLAWDTFPVPKKLKIDKIVPARSVEMLARLIRDYDTFAMGMADATHVGFEFGYTTLVTRRIDGTFPNFRQLIPDALPNVVNLPYAESLKSIKRIATLGRRNSPLRLTPALDNTTLIDYEEPDGIKIKHTVEGENSLDETFTIGLNADFFAEGIEALVPAEDRVTLKMISPLRPVVLTDSRPDGGYLLMPIRLAS